MEGSGKNRRGLPKFVAQSFWRLMIQKFLFPTGLLASVLAKVRRAAGLARRMLATVRLLPR